MSGARLNGMTRHSQKDPFHFAATEDNLRIFAMFIAEMSYTAFALAGHSGSAASIAGGTTPALDLSIIFDKAEYAFPLPLVMRAIDGDSDDERDEQPSNNVDWKHGWGG